MNSENGHSHARGLGERDERRGGTASHTSASGRESLHPNLGPAGLKIYSPVPNNANEPGSDLYMNVLANDERSVAMIAGYYSADFTAMQLLRVMSRLTKADVPYLPYFMLCRELGVRAVDGMVKGRVLDLRWSEPVSKDNGEEEQLPRSSLTGYSGLGASPPMNYNAAMAASGSGTAIDDILGPPPPIDDEVPVPPMEMHGTLHSGNPYEEEYLELVGPKLMPITPIMRYAMAEVIEEYEDEQSNPIPNMPRSLIPMNTN